MGSILVEELRSLMLHSVAKKKKKCNQPKLSEKLENLAFPLTIKDIKSMI